MNPLFVAPKDAMRLLGDLPKATFYALVAAGSIPSQRFGRSIRIPVAWIEQQAHDAYLPHNVTPLPVQRAVISHGRTPNPRNVPDLSKEPYASEQRVPGDRASHR